MKQAGRPSEEAQDYGTQDVFKFSVELQFKTVFVPISI
jgi:hypothetical protein